MKRWFYSVDMFCFVSCVLNVFCCCWLDLFDERKCRMKKMNKSEINEKEVSQGKQCRMNTRIWFAEQIRTVTLKLNSPGRGFWVNFCKKCGDCGECGEIISFPGISPHILQKFTTKPWTGSEQSWIIVSEESFIVSSAQTSKLLSRFWTFFITFCSSMGNNKIRTQRSLVRMVKTADCTDWKKLKFELNVKNSNVKMATPQNKLFCFLRLDLYGLRYLNSAIEKNGAKMRRHSLAKDFKGCCLLANGHIINKISMLCRNQIIKQLLLFSQSVVSWNVGSLLWNFLPLFPRNSQARWLS